MKHTIKGFITYEKPSYRSTPTIDFRTYRPTPDYSPNVVVVAEHSIEVEVPDDFNPIPEQVAALKEKQRLMRLDLARELAVIEDQIGKLQCITNDVPA